MAAKPTVCISFCGQPLLSNTCNLCTPDRADLAECSDSPSASLTTAFCNEVHYLRESAENTPLALTNIRQTPSRVLLCSALPQSPGKCKARAVFLFPLKTRQLPMVPKQVCSPPSLPSTVSYAMHSRSPPLPSHILPSRL